MSSQLLLVFPFDSPSIRYVVASDAVNSTYPSPDAICCVETAPALPQPVAAVFVSEFPLAVAPTTDVHTTACAPVGGGVDASSFVIVPTAWTRAIVAPTGELRFTTNVSLLSTVVS